MVSLYGLFSINNGLGTVNANYLEVNNNSIITAVVHGRHNGSCSYLPQSLLGKKELVLGNAHALTKFK